MSITFPLTAMPSLEGETCRLIYAPTLQVLNPPPHELPASLRKGLAKAQEELLAAWDEVRIIPAGSSPGVW